MAVRTHHLLIPKLPTLQPPKPNSRLFPSPTLLTHRTRKTLIKCSDESSADYSELTSNLAKEMAKMNTLLAQRAEAMEKSREILFKELCLYLSMGSDEVRRQWRKMEEEEKWVLVKGFVSDWGVNFHPLSARSVKDLIEEHLREGEDEDEENGSSKSSSSSSSASSSLFPSLKNMLWFSQNK